MDEYSRYAIRVTVAQICQKIGWTKIQSTPLEVLIDLMQEYILSVGKRANSYATLYGHSEPNLTHVSLAFRDMNISCSELQDYIDHFESGSVLEVPKYPIHKESHLNHLKPGSREVLTRPVHIHDHLPPMYPELEGEDPIISNSPTYDYMTDRISPLPQIKIKSEQYDSTYDERNEFQSEDEARPLRELSSVLMTTSGFLSSAREGKLPEIRSMPSESVEVDESKNIKSLEDKKKKDKENRFKKKHLSDKTKSDKKSKHKKKHKKTTSAHKNPPIIPPNKCDEPLFPHSPKQISTEIMQNDAKTENESTLSLLINDFSSPQKLNVASAQYNNLETNLSYDLLSSVTKKDKSKTKYHDSLNINDNNLSLIDLFSVPQLSGNECANFEDTESAVDVVNSSPMNNFDYCNRSNSSFDFDIAGSIPIVHGSPVLDYESRSPILELGRNSPDIKIERASPKIEIENRSHEIQVEFKNPEVNQECVSPEMKLGNASSTFDYEKLNSPIHFPRTSPISKPKEMQPIQQVVECTTFQGSHNLNNSGFLKKKKKKDKKNKTKDKDLSEVHIMHVDNTQFKQKIKKKKKDSKKEKHTYMNNKTPIRHDFDTVTIPPKKIKLQSMLNGENEKKKKEVTFNNIQQVINIPEANVIPKISDDMVSVSQPTVTNYEPVKKIKHEDKKKEKKEKRREKEYMSHLSEDLFSFEPLKRVKDKDKHKLASPVPKIIFKLGPSPPKTGPEPKTQKIIIKPVVKKPEYMDTSSPAGQLQHSSTQPDSSSKYINGSYSLPNTYGNPAYSTFPNSTVSQESTLGNDSNQIWICPACNRPDDGSPMIACDLCDLWFHWVCVGIREAIEGDWYCKMCLAKKEQDKVREKKKKHKKKKL